MTAIHAATAPPGAGVGAASEPIELHCAGSETPLIVMPSSGRSYHITARDPAACIRLLREALRSPAAELVPRAGGLLSGLSVLENIVLPAVYHQRVSYSHLTELVYRAFDACDRDRSAADELCARTVSDLDPVETRLVALVRALLMRPGAMLFERLFEGLAATDMLRVGRFPDFYRRLEASGTVVLVDLAGMGCPEMSVDVRADAE
jgi:ABC-type transporter Mla maintaining outer membrane lipid asymmetry ATPase subunit MlaF